MRFLKIIMVLTSIIFILSGCMAPANDQPLPGGAIAQPCVTLAPANTASGEYPSENIVSDIPGSIFDSDFSGTSFVGLSAVLDRAVKSQKPLIRFEAEIHDVKKVSNLEYIFTVDKIELNDKFEDSSLNEEPFYFNNELKQEEIRVPYDTVLILFNDVPMPIGEEFIKYINENNDDEGNPLFVYYFYLFGDEVAFIHDIYRP